MRSRLFAVLVLLSVPLSAQTVSTVAGSGAGGLRDGLAHEAQFNRPTWLDFDSKKNALYVVDRANHKLRKIVDGNVTTPPVHMNFWDPPSSLVELDFGGPFGGGIAIEPFQSGCGTGPWAHGIFLANSARH